MVVEPGIISDTLMINYVEFDIGRCMLNLQLYLREFENLTTHYPLLPRVVFLRFSLQGYMKRLPLLDILAIRHIFR